MVSGIVFGLNIPFRGSKFTLVFIAVTYISEVGCRGRHHLTRQLGHRVFAREDVSLHHVAQPESHHAHGLVIATRTRHCQRRSTDAHGVSPVVIRILSHVLHGLFHELEEVSSDHALTSIVEEETGVFMYLNNVVFVYDPGEEHVVPHGPYWTQWIVSLGGGERLAREIL